MQEHVILIRGGGDLATGVAQKLARAGFRLLLLEARQPTAIRRSVSLSEAVYEGTWRVEDIICRRIDSLAACGDCWRQGEVPLLVDPAGESIAAMRPMAVIDAIMAKRNLGTSRAMAPVTVALGPGFVAQQDVDAVIETMRGHDLGRLLLRGEAAPNTGIPGEIGGQGALRVLHTPAAGVVVHHRRIGDIVRQGEPLFSIGGATAYAPFDGLLRGLVREGLTLAKGVKAADVDPRKDTDWQTISDKARCLGGAVLEAVLYLSIRQNGRERHD